MLTKTSINMKPYPQLMDVVNELAYAFCLHIHQEKHLRYTVRDLQKVAGVKPIHLYSTQEINKLLYYWISKGAKGDTLARKFRFAKRIFTYAREMAYIKKNPCFLVRLPKTELKEIVSLTQDELLAIESSKIPYQSLAKAKTFFLFQCYTGLSYCDVKNFNASQIETYLGKKYIVINRQKSNTQSIIPLSEKAEKLLQDCSYKIPALCNQRLNKNLKEIAKLAGIKKQITTHTGRKTFGQLQLQKGVSIHTVSRMLGHSSVTITQRHYANANIHSVHNELERMALATAA